ncbi:unnamed protein product [Trifolium pratense]|uniref:Uncharacterized protein n=1 Tax=Trifolium pratense TaxID=57577 RepID=A0ACB0JAM0_TRIPR|nr:unnamed protein product [Trifolium pratense]
MFYLSKIEHKLTLPPYLLALPIREAILSELERLFLDKVIAKLGLCISFYDIISIKGGSVFPGDGAPTYLVQKSQNWWIKITEVNCAFQACLGNSFCHTGENSY